ncbi:MAG: homocysteine biosynthesis protein [Methanoculleaceae archaeon]
MGKSIDIINERIRDGNARVVTAEEMPDIVDELGVEGALEEVDVVTTGTFGAMCSSGAFLNFGHADPPIKIERAWLNDVEVYTGLAAVDVYLGATQPSHTQGIDYGGAHVLEDLVSGRTVELRARSHGTDCYPRRSVITELTLDDINQAVMVNPRNSYRRYAAATNSTDRVLNTYLGTLLPGYGNVSYSGSGVLNPLANDPEFRVIGSGTPIFLGGAEGMVIGQGTQHSPASGMGNLMVTGDLHRMSPDYLRAATITRFGVTLYVGVGIPIPVLDTDIVRSTAVRDSDIITEVYDYGVPSRDRPVIAKVTYADLRSGSVEISGTEVRTSSMSSFRKARDIARELAEWIRKGRMTLAYPVRPIPRDVPLRPMRESRRSPLVRDIMTSTVVSISDDDDITTAARTLLRGETNHLTVIDSEGRLSGIVTTYDISKAVARPRGRLRVRDIMTSKVVTTRPEEPVDIAALKLKKHNISALPVIDSDNRVVGMLSAIDLGTLFGKGWSQ